MRNSGRVLLSLSFRELKRELTATKYFAEIDVTDNCNLRCRHCYHFNDKKELVKEEAAAEVWEERLQGLYDGGVRFVLLVGGEPALRKDVLMIADRIFPFVYVITNGTIRIPEEFDRRLFVSMDGLEETNDAMRGKGVFGKILKNYAGDGRVAINMTITKDNYRELEGVVKLAIENGFAGVVCNICAGGNGINLPYAVKRTERKTITDELRRVKKLYPKKFMLTDGMIDWYEKPDHRVSCFWGNNVLHYDASWKRRRCFSSNADCGNCGCFAGSLQNPVITMLTSREALKLF